MTYCVEHVSLVRSDMRVINTEESEVMIMKNVQNPHKTAWLPHRICVVQYVLDKKEYMYEVYLHMHMCVKTVHGIFCSCEDLQ